MRRRWWKEGVVYQIYPRSFMDSNGDGVGDLVGICEKLDYLKSLGVDIIWLSPVFPSPNDDNGYDISDYRGIQPEFGTFADWERLLKGLHDRDMRLLMDLVANHTSDEHSWFVESRKSKDNPYRDYYIWRPPSAEGEPNNWASCFGGSAWQFDETTGEYFLHLFSRKQPDLNWRNPAVREAMYQTLRFWLNRGADGFRIDAADMLLKDRTLRSNPLNPDFKPGDAPDNAVIPKYTRNRPANHRLMAEIRRAMQPWNECLLLGELYQPVERLVTYYGTEARPELHLPLNLTLLHHNWNADAIQETIGKYYKALGPNQWPCWSLGNHDIRRLTSRTPGSQERLAAMLLMTLGGTPTLYYGDEIGIADVEIPKYLVDDPQTFSWPGHSRDVARTPMKWDASPQAGFTSGRPWLPVGDYSRLNVQEQAKDEKSLFSLHKKLIEVRRLEPALATGRFNPVERSSPLVAYERIGERRLLIVLNLSNEPQSFPISGSASILLSSQFERVGTQMQGSIPLKSEEGLIVLRKS